MKVKASMGQSGSHLTEGQALDRECIRVELPKVLHYLTLIRSFTPDCVKSSDPKLFFLSKLHCKWENWDFLLNVEYNSRMKM